MKHYLNFCKFLSNPKISKVPHVKEVLSLMNDAEIFCIDSSFKEKFSVSADGVKHSDEGYRDELDVPFQTIWIEMTDSEKESVSLTSDFHKESESLLFTLGLLIHEVEPKLFRIWSYYQVMEYEENTKKFKHKNYMMYETSMYGRIADAYIKRINQESWGVENPGEIVKLGSGKSKVCRRIRRVIHIAPKKLRNKISGVSNKKIDWSHSWSVRGHWRKINGIGKDRNNKESVVGYTWVNSHVKGNGELVKKTRIVKNILQ